MIMAIVLTLLMSATTLTGCEKKQQQVYMGLWGNIGEEGYVFDMNGTTGKCTHYDLAEGKEDGESWQLTLVSYDSVSGQCVIDAHSEGQRIGRFDGIFEEDEMQLDEETTHLFQQYKGKFKDAKGEEVDFLLYYD